MRCKALLAICLMIFSPAFVAEADEPKLRVEVVGSDGKPVKGGTITFESYGGEPVKKPTAGEVIVIKVLDQRAHMGSKVVMIPKTGSITVVVQTRDWSPATNYSVHAHNARQASEAGDLDQYNAEALQAKEALDEQQAQVDGERGQVEKWRDDNYLPPMTPEDIDAATARGRANGIKDSSSATRLLMRYKSYLIELRESEADLERHQDDFKTLKPPAKRITMAPTTCPDGSGGLLAGWINSITGSDLDPACGIDPGRDKNRRGGGGDDHEREDDRR